MKIFKTALAVLFVSLMASCSSDDGTPATNTPTGPEATYFNYKLDGETITMNTYNGFISEDEVRVEASSADGTSFGISFTTHGNLAQAISMSSQNPLDVKLNYQYFRKNYFDFELVWIANGQAKVNFAGKLYADGYDLESEFSTVEGSFVVNLTPIAPQVAGAGLSATLNGNSWHDVGYNQSSGMENGSSYWSLNFNSDDEYGISFYFNPNNLAVGNYTFDAESNENKVVISKYNAELGYEEELTSTSGTFNVTSITEVAFSNLTIFEGTFTVTATDPTTNEVVTVTNGVFKTAHNF